MMRRIAIVTENIDERPARFALREFKRLFKKMGCRVEASEDKGPKADAIVTLRVDASEFKGDAKKADAYRIRGGGRRLALTGANGRSLLYAVYRLAEEMGFVFLELGAETPPPKAPARLPSLDVRAVARLARRGFTCVDASGDPKGFIDWMAKHGMNHMTVSPFGNGAARRHMDDLKRQGVIDAAKDRGIVVALSGHAFSDFLPYELLAAKHRDYLALKNGMRGKDMMGGYFCTSNAGARRLFVKNTLDFIHDYPWVDEVGVWPNDGTGWCECKRCRDAGPPIVRYLDIVDELARSVKGEFPEKTFTAIAYRDTMEPDAATAKRFPHIDAITVAFMERTYSHAIDDPKAPGLIVQRPDHLGGQPANQTYYRLFRQWLRAFPKKVELFEYYSKDMWVSLPNVFPSLIAKEMNLYARRGVVGLGIHYGQKGNWATFRLNYFATARAMWSPAPGGAQNVEEFCRRLYPGAWREMTRFYDLMERGFYSHMKWYWRFDFESVRVPDGAREALGRARAKARDARERARIAKALVSLDYVDKVAEAREWFFQGAAAGHYYGTRFWLSQNYPRIAAEKLRAMYDQARGRAARGVVNAASERIEKILPGFIADFERLAAANVRHFQKDRLGKTAAD